MCPYIFELEQNTRTQVAKMSSEESIYFDLEEDTQAEYAVGPPSGVLSVHIKLLRDIDETHISVAAPELYVRIQVGSFIKSTETVVVQDSAVVAVDDLKHFSLKISRKRSDPSNEVRFDLILVESPRVHRIVGHTDMHLYDIIKNLFVAGSYDLKYRHQTVAVVDLEMCFTYGIFGYGCCHQLQNRKKKISDIVGHSLLLRVDPPETRYQPNAGHVMSATPVGHPKFINFSVKSAVGPGLSEDVVTKSSNHEVCPGLELHEPVVLNRTIRKRLQRIQTDFAQQGTRLQRKRFLERLVLSHIHDHHAIDTDTDAQGGLGPGTSTGPGAAGARPSADQLPVTAGTYGTDSDYAESATDLGELMSAMLKNAPGLVPSRAPARRLEPSLLSVDESEDEDSTTEGLEAEISIEAPPAVEGRRRSALAELPGLLVRLPGLFVRYLVNRLTAWRTRGRAPELQQTKQAADGDDEADSQGDGRG